MGYAVEITNGGYTSQKPDNTHFGGFRTYPS
jgi:hypothetical protein